MTPAAPSPLRLAFAGSLSMAVAMGFGRFAYTPILPAMVAGLHLSKAQAGWLASANFAGYLLGALAGALPLKGSPRRWLLGGLLASVLSTLGMGLTSDLWLQAGLRFVSGLASAAVLVFASTLVLAAVLLNGVPPVTTGVVAVTVMLFVAPTAYDAVVQVTVWPATPQLQPVPAAEIAVKPAGSVSLTVTPVAANGPLLRGASVKVIGAPDAGVPLDAVLVMARSVPVVMVTLAVVLSLAGL